MKENPAEKPDPIKEHTDHTEKFFVEEEARKAAKKALENLDQAIDDAFGAIVNPPPGKAE